MQQGVLSYLLSLGSCVFSYLDDWLIKTSVLLLSTKKRRERETLGFFKTRIYSSVL